MPKYFNGKKTNLNVFVSVHKAKIGNKRTGADEYRAGASKRHLLQYAGRFYNIRIQIRRSIRLVRLRNRREPNRGICRTEPSFLHKKYVV